jgi:glucosamine kinase
MAFFLGIDGGGSKTTCAVGDESSLLATATSGGSNIVRLGEEQAALSLQAAIRQACTAAKVQPSQVAAVCVGVAGASVPEVSVTIRRLIGAVVGGQIEVVGDMVIAMEAAFGEGPGVIVLAGTGSIAYGRNERGQTARAGGWGFAISDQGSGHWIGRRAVQAVLQAHDAEEATALRPALLDAWGLQAVEDLVRVANSSPPPDFAQLFPHVQVAAGHGDPLAREILTSAGADLGRLCTTVLTRLWSEEQNPRVAMVGGVFEHSPLVRRVFQNSVRATHPQVRLEDKVVEPVLGALQLARRSAQDPASRKSQSKKAGGD